MQAFLQTPVERELYMRFSSGLELEKVKTKDYVMKINLNIYDQKQEGRGWFK